MSTDTDTDTPNMEAALLDARDVTTAPVRLAPRDVLRIALCLLARDAEAARLTTERNAALAEAAALREMLASLQLDELTKFGTNAVSCTTTGDGAATVSVHVSNLRDAHMMLDVIVAIGKLSSRARAPSVSAEPNASAVIESRYKFMLLEEPRCVRVESLGGDERITGWLYPRADHRSAVNDNPSWLRHQEARQHAARMLGEDWGSAPSVPTPDERPEVKPQSIVVMLDVMSPAYNHLGVVHYVDEDGIVAHWQYYRGDCPHHSRLKHENRGKTWAAVEGIPCGPSAVAKEPSR